MTRGERLEGLAAQLAGNEAERLRWERGRIAASQRDDSGWVAECVKQLGRLERARRRLQRQVERVRSEGVLPW
jgi:hypothetical protein